MQLVGIIGGSGFCDYPGLDIKEIHEVETPFGLPSAALRMGELYGKPLVFLPRHGEKHTIAPHKINYRANVHAMKQVGVTDIFAIASVGGITSAYKPGVMAVPDQLIDYTMGREQSFFSDNFSADRHCDFTWPFQETLRQQLMQTTQKLSTSVLDGGTYGVMQGPRFETAAEINRLQRDGCDMVGMTAMPEAVLARELDINYAMLVLVANWAAGINNSVLQCDEIYSTISSNIKTVQTMIAEIIRSQ